MSFFEKARQSATQGLAQLTSADGTSEVRGAAAQVGTSMREMAGSARRGIVTVIERIDPDTLADLIIKATAIQEVTNAALARKGAAYRIGDISITATIPPQIGFAISRVGDVAAPVDSQLLRDSTELHADGDAAVLSLDGEVVPD